MRLSIVALALANVAALPVPKASFLRGAREHPCQIRHRRDALDVGMTTATGSVLVLDGGPWPGINKCTLNGVPQTYDLFGPYQPIGNGCSVPTISPVPTPNYPVP